MNNTLKICAIIGSLALSGCLFDEEFQRGYIVPENALEQIPVGSTEDKVLSVMGTPSTIATVQGDVYYYISQKAQRSAAFMPPDVVEQRVIAVYFDKRRKVSRIADYGLQDGKVFDFISRTTATSGDEQNIVRQLFKIIGS